MESHILDKLYTNSLQERDKMNISENKDIIKKLASNESVVFSCLIDKFNRKNKCQQRTFLLTQKAIYNIEKTDIRRRIPLDRLRGITISQTGSEFVLHVPDEYDYRFRSNEYRDSIIDILKLHIIKRLRIFLKDDITLEKYTTTQPDKKKNISKMPDEVSDVLQPFGVEIDSQKISTNDFKILKVLGRGTFGKVMLVQKISNSKFYAMKTIDKQSLLQQDTLEHTKLERQILEKLKSPFLVKLEMAFTTPDKLIFVMDFKQGGELFQYLKKEGMFSEDKSKFYVAEILMALNNLHSQNIVYRDLKPENVLLDSDGHIAITDFGISKILDIKRKRTNSYVGTPEYLSPEIINRQDYSFSTDIWSLGVLTYEMIFGRPPFYSQSQQNLFDLITHKDVKFPLSPQISELGRDFIMKLLNKDQNTRVFIEQIMMHPWLKDIDWDKLEQKLATPPFVPAKNFEGFDQLFTNENPIISYNPIDILKQADIDDKIGEFYYNKEEKLELDRLQKEINQQ